MDVLLCDNGGEFPDAFSFENDREGEKEISLFYCDPMRSSQKPFIEKNHTLFRDIVPKGSSFGFHEVAGITVMDLCRKVSRKPPKSKTPIYKKRQDRRYLQGRTYKDYNDYLAENPDAFVTQMDTVYNDESHGPFIQTFKFVKACLLFALLHREKTASAMLSGVCHLEEILGSQLFRKYVHVLLTDRGSEFSSAQDMETAADGSRRTRVFFCAPMQSGQKGTLESKHVDLRYILPRQTDLRRLGLD